MNYHTIYFDGTNPTDLSFNNDYRHAKVLWCASSNNWNNIESGTMTLNNSVLSITNGLYDITDLETTLNTKIATVINATTTYNDTLNRFVITTAATPVINSISTHLSRTTGFVAADSTIGSDAPNLSLGDVVVCGLSHSTRTNLPHVGGSFIIPSSDQNERKIYDNINYKLRLDGSRSKKDLQLLNQHGLSMSGAEIVACLELS